MAQNQRQLIRQQCRKKRKTLSGQQQLQASENILVQCLRYNQLEEHSKVALYLASDGEIDPIQIIQYCWRNNIQTYLPVIHPFSAGHLLFLHYHAHSQMRANRFGIAEPKLQVQNVCPVTALDRVFTPLVAFDREGNRMGMGGGFYDRTLAVLKKHRASTQVVGLAHECQEVEHLPVESWDIPLAKIITPEKVFCI